MTGKMNRVSIFPPGLQGLWICDIDQTVHDKNIYLIVHIGAEEDNEQEYLYIIIMAQSSMTCYLIAIGYFQNNGTYTLALLRVKLSLGFTVIVILANLDFLLLV